VLLHDHLFGRGSRAPTACHFCLYPPSLADTLRANLRLFSTAPTVLSAKVTDKIVGFNFGCTQCARRVSGREAAHQNHCSLIPPCATHKPGEAQNSLRSNSCASDPWFIPLLGGMKLAVGAVSQQSSIESNSMVQWLSMAGNQEKFSKFPQQWRQICFIRYRFSSLLSAMESEREGR